MCSLWPGDYTLPSHPCPHPPHTHTHTGGPDAGPTPSDGQRCPWHRLPSPSAAGGDPQRTSAEHPAVMTSRESDVMNIRCPRLGALGSDSGNKDNRKQPLRRCGGGRPGAPFRSPEPGTRWTVSTSRTNACLSPLLTPTLLRPETVIHAGHVARTPVMRDRGLSGPRAGKGPVKALLQAGGPRPEPVPRQPLWSQKYWRWMTFPFKKSTY